jgi:hypothetical protein
MSTETYIDPIAQQATAATAKLAEMKSAYESSPARQLERAQEYVNRLGNDTSAQISARAEVARLQRAVPEPASLPDRIEAALSPAPEGVVADTTTGDQLSMSAMRELVADYRSIGMSDDTIREAIHGGTAPAHIIQQAQDRMAERLADPVWTAKLAAQDKATRKEWVLLNIVVNAHVAA